MKTGASSGDTEQLQQVQIDYDKLASAMLRQQASNSGNEEQEVVPVNIQPSTSQQEVRDQPQADCAPASSGISGPPAQFSDFLQNLFAGGQKTSPMVRYTSNRDTVQHDLHLTQPTQQLLQCSLSPSSRRMYLRSWTLLIDFCKAHAIEFKFPCSSILICNFIGHLFSTNYSSSSITSHISAISYVHKLCEACDPTHSFIVKKILKGAHNLSKTCDTRLPITKPILMKLISAIQHTVPSVNDRILLKAIFLLAFHGFMRLGELVVRSMDQTVNVIQRTHIAFLDDSSVQISLHHYKHMKNSQPLIITLTSNGHSQFCPVKALKHYVSIYNHKSGPLFTFMSGQPVPHSFVSSHLTAAIKFIGLNPKVYLGHSFRIGAATEAAKNGMSEKAIQQLGRWQSNAIQRYIRINAFKF